MRRNFSAVVVVSCLTCSLSVAADSFENEIGFDYSRTHHSKYDITSHDYGLVATRFLSAVTTDSGALGEAVFLARVPALGLNLTHLSADSGEGSATQWRYGFEARFASMQTPLTAAIGMLRVNDKSQNSFASGAGHNANPDYEGVSGTLGSRWQKTEVNIFHGGIGAYVTDSSHMGIDYTRLEPDSVNMIAAHTWQLSGKHLATISETQSLSISADVQRTVYDAPWSSTNRTLTAALEYYFTRATSVGARVVKLKDDDAVDPISIERHITISTFITPEYRAGISLQNRDSGASRTFGFDVSARF